jgi:hypothetical protein
MKIFITICVLFLPITSYAASFDHHINNHYLDLVEALKDNGLPGPIAKEIAPYALIRQLHEDGLDRPPTYSVPGIGCGEWTGEIVKKCVKRVNPVIKLNKVVGDAASGGSMSLYCLQGEKANLIGALSVAHVFDYYVDHYYFSEADRAVWRRSKTYSYLLHCDPNLKEYEAEYKSLQEERTKIIQKCNRMYGPGSGRIESTINKLNPLFERNK